jgi:hypothetical protein
LVLLPSIPLVCSEYLHKHSNMATMKVPMADTRTSALQWLFLPFQYALKKVRVCVSVCVCVCVCVLCI